MTNGTGPQNTPDPKAAAHALHTQLCRLTGDNQLHADLISVTVQAGDYRATVEVPADATADVTETVRFIADHMDDDPEAAAQRHPSRPPLDPEIVQAMYDATVGPALGQLITELEDTFADLDPVDLLDEVMASDQREAARRAYEELVTGETDQD